jgi:hypothetical protein
MQWLKLDQGRDLRQTETSMRQSVTHSRGSAQYLPSQNEECHGGGKTSAPGVHPPGRQNE